MNFHVPMLSRFCIEHVLNMFHWCYEYGLLMYRKCTQKKNGMKGLNLGQDRRTRRYLVQTAPNNPLSYQSVDSVYITRECTYADANDDPVIAEVRLIHSTTNLLLTLPCPKSRAAAESTRNLVRRFFSCVQNCVFHQKTCNKIAKQYYLQEQYYI